jgi:tRNA threonylcarbamoyl adenosine modification protein (Sua5/YciO/YrdC/YwlC family)
MRALPHRSQLMIVEINPRHPEPRKIARAVQLLEAGEIVAYPTDTAYGLACDSGNKKAIDKLYALKHMERGHPLAFVCPGLADIARYAIVENREYRILKHYLPGPYCFVLKATREVPKIVQSKRKTIGIRVPGHPVALALVQALGRPLLSSTATNEEGDPFVDPGEIDQAYRQLGLVLDAGAGGALCATVIDLSGDAPEVLREGAGSIEQFAG